MAAISDSSSPILFSRTQRLDLLRQVFTEIIIPPAVRDDVLAASAKLPGAESVARELGILDPRSGLLPSDKADLIARLEAEHLTGRHGIRRFILSQRLQRTRAHTVELAVVLEVPQRDHFGPIVDGPIVRRYRRHTYAGPCARLPASRRLHIIAQIGCQAWCDRAIGIEHVQLEIAVALGDERDALSISRPGWRPVARRALRKVDRAAAVRASTALSLSAAPSLQSLPRDKGTWEF